MYSPYEQYLQLEKIGEHLIYIVNGQHTQHQRGDVCGWWAKPRRLPSTDEVYTQVIKDRDSVLNHIPFDVAPRKLRLSPLWPISSQFSCNQRISDINDLGSVLFLTSRLE